MIVPVETALDKILEDLNHVRSILREAREILVEGEAWRNEGLVEAARRIKAERDQLAVKVKEPQVLNTSMKRLTEDEWRQVFKLRCKSKLGQLLTVEDRALTERAFLADSERYAAMEDDIFNATVPFGSTVRK
jgi:hypothetical protein